MYYVSVNILYEVRSVDDYDSATTDTLIPRYHVHFFLYPCSVSGVEHGLAYAQSNQFIDNDCKYTTGMKKYINSLKLI